MRGAALQRARPPTTSGSRDSTGYANKIESNNRQEDRAASNVEAESELTCGGRGLDHKPPRSVASPHKQPKPLLPPPPRATGGRYSLRRARALVEGKQHGPKGEQRPAVVEQLLGRRQAEAGEAGLAAAAALAATSLAAAASSSSAASPPRTEAH